MFYISTKFHEKILNGGRVKEWIRFYDRPTDGQMDRQELRFLSSSSRLMMLYISMKCHENVLNGFQVIDRARNDQCQISKGNNSKKVKTYISMMFHDNIFQVIERTRNDRCLISNGNNASNV